MIRTVAAVTLALLLVSTGEAQEGVPAGDPPVAVTPGSSRADATFTFTQARLLAEKGAFQASVEAFQEVARLQPDDPYVHLEFALVLLRIRDLDRAAEQARVAHELSPENVDVLDTLGRVLIYLGERDREHLEEALAVYDQLLALDPENVNALATAGRVYQFRGEPGKASELFERAVATGIRNPGLYEAWIDSALAAGEKERAEAGLGAYLALFPGDLDRRLQLAELLSEREGHAEAVTVLRATPADQAEDERVLRRLALELFQAADLGASLATVDRLVETAESPVRYQLLRARLLESMNRPLEAREELEAIFATAADQVDPEVAQQLARLQAATGDVDEARATLDWTATRLESSGRSQEADRIELQLATLLASLGEWEEALDMAARVDSVELRQARLLLQADSLLALQRYDEVLGVVSGADPSLLALQSRHAEALYRLDRPEEGDAIVETLTRQSDLGALRVAALLFQKLEYYERSIPVLSDMLDLDPTSIEARYWLGAAYERTERPAQAAEAFQDLLDDQPEFHPALNYLGYMWIERGENLDRAMDLVQRAVELQPGNGAYLDSLGWGYYQLGRYEEALQWLTRARELARDEPTILEHLGDTYLAVGRIDEARDAYRAVVALGGENADIADQKLRTLDSKR